MEQFRSSQQYVQINPALYWGREIIRFQNNKPSFGGINWLYDTHAANLLTFPTEEFPLLDSLKKFAEKPIGVNDLLYKIFSETIIPKTLLDPHRLSSQFVRVEDDGASKLKGVIQDLVENEVLLTGSRKVVFQKPNEAEVWIQSNHFCNLSCPGCSTGMDVVQDRKKTFDLVVLEQCLKKIVNDAKERGFRHLQIKLGGGEPTLNGGVFLHQVSEIARRLEGDQMSLNIVLLTNGIALTDTIINILRDDQIHVSISTDPFRKLGKSNASVFPVVLKHIKKAKDACVSVSAQLTVSGLNYEIVGDVYEQLADTEVSVHYSVFRPQTKTQFVFAKAEHITQAMMEVYSRAFKRIEQNAFVGNITSFDYLRLAGVKDGVCGAGKTYIVLDVDGSVYSCHESVRTKKNGGNIVRDQTNVFDMIDTAHAVPKNQRYTATTAGGTKYPFMWQGGFGCPWVAEKQHGTYDSSADYLVRVYEELAPVMLALIVKQQRKGVEYEKN